MPWEKYIAQQRLERRERQRNRESHGESFDRYSRRVKSLRGVGDLRGERGRAVVRTKRLSRVPLRRKKKTPRGRWTREGESEEPRREKNERARTRLLQDGWMGLLATWCEGCPGEVELPAIVARLIIVYWRRFEIRYWIMTGLWMLIEAPCIKENFSVIDKQNASLSNGKIKLRIHIKIIFGNSRAGWFIANINYLRICFLSFSIFALFNY